MLNLADYSVRPIKKEDLEVMLEWRNSDRVHSEMLTTHTITKEEHYNWFEKINSLKTPMNLIFLYKDRALGYVGFSDCDELNQRCSIGSYIGETINVPVDAGMMVDYLGIEYLFKFTKFNKIWSYVFVYNKRACRLNKLIGYTEEGVLRKHFLKNGKLEDVRVFSILRDEWEKKSEFIRNLYGGSLND